MKNELRKMSFSFYVPGEYQVELNKGKYLFECWGADGGGGNGGKGGYVYGIAKLSFPEIFYVFVGGEGEQNGNNVEQNGGFNGGGKGGKGISNTYNRNDNINKLFRIRN